ncbi:hypothetical protein BDV96DRAFT_608144 [Lophiotrema nucula]|uniref:Uncharacterized protein n=1 Tax=Lophiotrema nucula TaxID=690887 RepID=A0A6A5YE59_9PLEO|nr:hypothetical protein BDV96DRAFT_608144 [Lophiotrema nucula]
MFSSSTAIAARPPRRYVDRRRDRTTVTRRSAPARISVLPTAPSAQIQIQAPIETAIAVADASNVNTAASRFSLSRSGTKPVKPVRRRQTTLSFESSDSSADESDSSYNSFVLSLKKKDVLNLDTQLGVSESLDRISTRSDVSPTRSLKSVHDGGQSTTYKVLKSHYEGDLFRNSKLSAQLTVLPNRRPGQPEMAKPLFKWVHVENPQMRFGQFLDYVTRCPYLDDAERDGVSSILRTAREKSDRSLRLPPGMTGSYIEPEYFEETIETTTYQGPRSKRTRREVVRWLAVPYFFLTSTSEKMKFIPACDSSKVPKFARQGSIAHGDFFQVAQFWCIMVGDGFVVTCARMQMTEIPETLLKLSYIPPADPARPLTGERTPMLQISDGGLRLWLLPLDQCDTWPAFVASFVGLGFSLVDGWQVKYRSIILDPNDWSTIVAMAKKTTIRLELCRKDNVDEDDPNESSDDDAESQTLTSTRAAPAPASPADRGIDETPQTIASPEPLPTVSESPFFDVSDPESPLYLDGSGIQAAPRTPLRADDFHIFTLLATVLENAPSSTTLADQTRGQSTATVQVYRVDEKQLQRDLSELDSYMCSGNSRKMECSSYDACPKKTSYDVERSVSQLDATAREENVGKKVFVKASRDLFEFFLPLRYQDHAVIQKYWGGVDRVVQTKDIRDARGQFDAMLKELTNLARLAKEIRQELFAEKRISSYVITMFLSCFNTSHVLRSTGQIRRCKERLLQGRLKMIERLQPIGLREREAVMPLGLTLLLLGQLLHDSQGPLTPERHRLTSAYWAFFRDIKQKVHERPLSRKYEGTFSTLKSEFETIIGQLEDQQRVLIALEDSFNEIESRSFASSSAASRAIRMDPSREASVTEYLLQQTEEMLQNFAEMSRRLNELENWHFLSLSIDNDMQQKASFAFTTVTVFFLPLTTLAGILGMNTNDIRNMPENQWLFWSAAIPLGIICLSLWFFYLGTFQKAWRWVPELLHAYH